MNFIKMILNILLGKLGSPINNPKQIADCFLGDELFYLGHGTKGDISTIQSILENGLKVINPEAISAYDSHLSGLDSTTISFGVGSNHLYQFKKDLMHNWLHHDSKKIIICALPKDLIIPFRCSNNPDLFKAFYIGSEENGYKLRPEFIKGYYDVNEVTFTPNQNFYQYLDDDTKKKLIDETVSSYIDAYSKSGTISPLENLDFPRHIVDEQKAAVQWYKVQLSKFREYENRDFSTNLYDPSHDFDDVFYDSSSKSDFIPEENWDDFFSGSPTLSEFEDAIKDLNFKKEQDISVLEGSASDKGDDYDER